jgi:arylsulfatase A-like enzyme
MMRVGQVALFAGTLLGSLVSFSPLQAQPSRKPNILIIVADDMGYADCGVQGCKDIPTPSIDSIAKNGIRFTNGYVSGPYCSPTRAGLMTGRYQTRYGHEWNPGPGTAENPLGLSLKETTLATRLRALGYATGLVGKWHLGHATNYHPLDRGFQQAYSFKGAAHPYFPGKGAPIQRGREDTVEKEYLTDALRREALAFIDAHKKEPFFLYLAFNAVHTPLEATEKYLERFPNIKDEKRRTYAAMLSAMDDAIGAVLARLREAGIEENTLIFFISDNGGPTNVNGSNNFPLRGVKATTWEGGIRVPWMMQWKGRLPAGKTYDQPVIQLDMLPTSLAAVGAEVRPEWKIEGVNLLPYLDGKKEGPPHSSLFWRFGKQTAVRMGDWNLVEANGSNGKLLFNLRDDIGQTKDLSAAHPERVRELQAAWDEWNKENVPPLWVPQAKKAKDKKK